MVRSEFVYLANDSRNIHSHRAIGVRNRAPGIARRGARPIVDPLLIAMTMIDGDRRDDGARDLLSCDAEVHAEAERELIG